MKIKSMYLVFILFTSAFLLSGCAALLPSGSEVTKSKWGSYDEAKRAFDGVRVGETTEEQLRSMGFDSAKTPNIKILTFLDVKKQFLVTASDKTEHLPKGVRECIESADACSGLEINIVRNDSKRYGNVFLDIFNFRRQTEQKGWEFEGLIVLRDGVVVYKLLGGKPMIEGDKDQKNPLGPLQSLDGMFFLDSAK